MSQAGKILHLYVEVRSVPEDEGGHESRDLEVVDTTQLQGGEALPSHGHTSEVRHRMSVAKETYSPSRSPSRDSASYQLYPQGDRIEPFSVQRHSVPYDGISQLLYSLQPLTNGSSTLMRAHSSEYECFSGQSLHSSQASGRTTVPSTPISRRRSSDLLGTDEGQRSIVTFSYIEKANIRSLVRPQSSLCLKGPTDSTNPFNRPAEEKKIPAHLCKRLSDPIGLDGQESFCSPKFHCHASGVQALISPNLHHSTIDSIARAGTQRALKEFGSPELQCCTTNVSKSLCTNTTQQSHYQSRTSSPVPVHSSSTLPRTCTVDPQNNRSGCALPRSPATEQLSSHTRQPSLTLSPKPRSQESPKPAYKPAAPLYDKSSTAGTESPNSRRLSRTTNESPRSTQRVNFNLGNSHNKLADGMNQLSGKNPVSPVNSPEVARKLAEEATKLSAIFMEARHSPSPTFVEVTDSPRLPLYPSQETQGYTFSPCCGSSLQYYTMMNNPLPSSSRQDSIPLGSRHHSVKADMNSTANLPREQKEDSLTPSELRSVHGIGSPSIPTKVDRASPVCADMNSSPINDPPQQKPELLESDSSMFHWHQSPHYSGKSRTPSSERNYKPRYHQSVRETMEVSRKTVLVEYSGFPTADTLLNWTSQQQQFEAPASMELKYTEQLRKDADRAPDRDRGKSVHGTLVKSEIPPDGDQRTLASSNSSSGVTGSLGDSSHPDQDCISLETNQSSQKSSDTEHATSGTQSDSASSPVGPSLHSQKIARAKWEFLFGIPSSEDVPDASTAPPSESPTPTPPNSLRLNTGPFERGSEGVGQPLTSHSVQHVEVELVTPPPVASGASPKTGIIRRTIKYSETDLDAVPLRCYRETNIDEVLAEQEEADSAFGSNRSVLGTSGAGSSPLEGGLYARTDGEEDLEEELQDEEIVSWASVRMQGDRKRQHATQEEDEVFSLLLKRPLESPSESPMALKSPIAVTSPRRVSEDSLDTFSRHFESIVESHRAKGTSYSSLDSEDLLTSSQAIFTFDLPTLTPEIQGQICQSARDIIELSFAPLAQSDLSSSLDSSHGTGDQPHSSGSLEIKQEQSSEGLKSMAEDVPSGSSFDQNLQQNMQLSPREKALCLTSDPGLDQELNETRGLGSTDTLINGNKADMEAAKRLAKRLFNLDGFKKSDVARHLSKNNDFSQMVAEEYLHFFNFTGLTVDQALRVFLKEFALMGETQERERVLSHFSRRYLQCNPRTMPSEDSVHTLTCALMLLNTDLHGPNVGKRMSCPQFIGNLEGLNDGQDFPKDLLKALYNSIKSEKLQWTIDEEELRKSFSELADGRTDSASHTMKRISSGGNPFTGVAQQPSAAVYKNGFLVRKVHADSDGKKTPRGKRGWKTFYAILKGLILYLQKGEYRPEKQLSDEDLKNAVSIHHSLAMRAADYSKRPNVFYLRTADWRVFLFQAPNAEQMQSWITRINTVAAMFSAPPFPAAIGSQKKFSRPLLPGSTTKLSQEEQVQSHEARFRNVSSELTELRSYPPDRKIKGRELEEYRHREEYLEFEKTRYGTYAMLLRAKIRSGEDDLSAFESRLYDDNGLQRTHSSPTLQQESSQGSQGSTRGSTRGSTKGSIKGSKRSEGQRHSYRQAVKQ